MVYVVSMVITCIVVTTMLTFITAETKIRRLKKSQEEWLANENHRFSEKLSKIGNTKYA